MAAALPLLAASSSADVDAPARAARRAVDPRLSARRRLQRRPLLQARDQAGTSTGKTPATPASRPRIHWTLPAGITAGALQFPPPKRLPLGPLMDFGYENEVLFPVPHARASQLPSHGPATLARPRQLAGLPRSLHSRQSRAGRRRCTVAPRPRRRRVRSGSIMSLSTACEQQLAPRRYPPPTRPSSSPRRHGSASTVTTGQRETQAAFFPADQNILDNPAPQKVTPTAKGFMLELKKDARPHSHLPRS